jgi:hypothetical protein
METDMLALATAAHGQDPNHILIVLAAVGAAIFWRSLLKIGLALVIIGFFLLLITGAAGVIHGLHLIP